jgi:branched-chain amino acid transport system substrate-binding protein/neutral amino acid transport system substrate-binding protein
MKRLTKSSKLNRSDLLKRLGHGGAAALMLSITACGSVPQSTSQAPDAATSPSATTATGASAEGQLKIGTLLPITGDLAQYGTTMQDSVNLLGETVNACGGVLGQPVQIVSEDDQTDPAAGAAGMTKLAEVDRVGGVVGAAGSAVSSAAVDIAVRNQVVQISPSSTSPTFTDRARNGEFNGFWFRTAPPDTFQGDALAQLAQQQGAKRVAVLAINNDYGNGLVDSFIPAFKALGGTVTNESSPTKYAPDATTFDSELRAAFNGNPDAIVMVAYPETGSIILKQAQEQGLLDGNTKVLMSDGMKTDKLADLAGRTGDGQFIVSGSLGTAPSAGGPAITQFNDLYQKKFNRAPNVYDPNSWDAAAVIALAAEAAKATNGAAIKEQIREVTSGDGERVTDVCQGLALLREGKKINYEGASGTIDFNAEGDVVGSYDVWTIANDGKLQVQSKIEVSGNDS